MAGEEDVVQMSDVELSSDSEQEEDEDGVSLIVLRRPEPKMRVIEDVEVIKL